MREQPGKGEPGRWWLSLLYVAVVLTAAVSAALAPLVVTFAGDSSTPAGPAIVMTLAVAGGAVALVAVCLRVPAVRHRLRPGAASISASAATFVAVGWTFLVVTGVFSYRDRDDGLAAQVPFVLLACTPAVIVAVAALTISRPIQRDHDRRTAAAGMRDRNGTSTP